jgi:hypothetical protein
MFDLIYEFKGWHEETRGFVGFSAASTVAVVDLTFVDASLTQAQETNHHRQTGGRASSLSLLSAKVWPKGKFTTYNK